MRSGNRYTFDGARRLRRISGIGGFLLLLCVLAPPVAAANRWAILLAGASGDPALKDRYLRTLAELRLVLVDSLGMPRDHVVVLFEDPSKAPDLVSYMSNREGLAEAVRNLSARVRPEDLVLVFIEGHGAFDGKIYKLNLVGPDPTGEELADILYQVRAHCVIVNATSASGATVPALSRKGSIVLTATKSGTERNQTHMGRFFAEAFRDNAADSDKNGRVSILEAFLFVKRRVESYYENEGKLQTEHPVLDDTGAGRSSAAPSPESGVGLLARTTFLDSGGPAMDREGLTTEQKALMSRARELEEQIEALKYRKGDMPEEEYENKLEELLLKLAEINVQLSR